MDRSSKMLRIRDGSGWNKTTGRPNISNNKEECIKTPKPQAKS